MSDPSPVRSDAKSTPSSPAGGNDPVPDQPFDNLNREQTQSALFAQMVMQQVNLALMLLGKSPHPESGQSARDLDAAKMFIDQLEMLEAKTKGNLSSQESALLKQSLMTVRLAFVEEVNKPEAPAKSAESTVGDAENKSKPGIISEEPAEEESKKRFSKKYSA